MPDIALFVTVRMPMNRAVDRAVNLAESGLVSQLNFLQSHSSVSAIEIYVPEETELNNRDLQPAPELIIQIDFKSCEHALALTRSDQFKATIGNPQAYTFPVDSITIELTDSVQFPLTGQKEVQPRTAPLSFVVRYYGPVFNMAKFVHFYTHNHAPILGEFAGVRNVFCYLPVDWESKTEISDNQLILGNEVVFDDLQALQHALTTDVLAKAKADSKLFQSFGSSTHYAMRRSKFFCRDREENSNVQ